MAILITHALKQKGILPNLQRKYFRYNEVLETELMTQLQMLDFIAMFTIPDHLNHVTTTALTCMVEQKLAFNYIHNQLMECKTKLVLAEPSIAHLSYL